jgi:hypothetical protein
MSFRSESFALSGNVCAVFLAQVALKGLKCGASSGKVVLNDLGVVRAAGSNSALEGVRAGQDTLQA